MVCAGIALLAVVAVLVWTTVVVPFVLGAEGAIEPAGRSAIMIAAGSIVVIYGALIYAADFWRDRR